MSIPTDDLKNRLKFAMLKMGMRPIELSEKTKIPKSSISQYMSGYTKPNGERVYLISKVLGVSEAWLMGFDVPMERDKKSFVDNLPEPGITEAYTTFPVIGEVAAGYEHIAIEDWEGDVVDIPLSYLHGRSKSDFFVLKVKGDSMYPDYKENDKVLVLKQSTLDHSGQVGVIIYNDDNATLKKVEYVQGEDWMRLIPINPSFPPIEIENDELEHCRVLGIPKLVIREVNPTRANGKSVVSLQEKSTAKATANSSSKMAAEMPISVTPKVKKKRHT